MKLERLLTTLGILRPIAKAMPIVGTQLEGGIEAVIKICEFAQNVKTNKEDSQELAKRAAQYLESIVRVTKDTDLQTRGVLKEHINEMCSVLEKIKISLEKRARGTGNAIWNKHQITEDIKRLKDELEDVTKCFLIAAQMNQEIAIRKLIQTAEHDTLNQLNPIFQGYLDTVDAWSGCLQNTRVQLLADLFHWIDYPGSQPPICWLSGLAGTGKSTIAISLSERLQKYNKDDSSLFLGAWFFCSRQYAQCTVACNIVLTLAYQLALLDYDFRHHICTALEKKPDLAKQPLKELVLNLIQEPLQNLKLSVLFMIDALDECEHHGGNIVPLLAATACHVQGRLRLIITSRPEHRIQQMFDKLGSTIFALHDMDTVIVQTDIASYLVHKFHQIKEEHAIHDPDWPSSQAIATLVSRSGTLFIYAATVVKYISQPPYNPQHLLQHLLTEPICDHSQGSPYNDVDRLYTQVLHSAVSSAHTEIQRSSLAGRISRTVGTIMLLQIPLSVTSLVTLLGLNTARITYDLHALSAILLVPANPSFPVQIFHPSFSEFLMDPVRCRDPQFLINTKEIHTHVALCCLHVMNAHLHFNMTAQAPLLSLNSSLSVEQIEKGFSEPLQYACKYWMHHICLASIDDRMLVLELQKFTEKKILNWIEAESILNVLPLAINTLQQVQQWASSSSELAHVAMIIHDMQRICQVFYPAISMRCMDVYHSVIALGPDIPARIFNDQLPPAWPHVQLLSARSSHWYPWLLGINTSSVVNSVSFSPDGKYILSGSKDKTVRIWDALTGEQVSVLEGHTGEVNSCSFTPDGKHIVSESNDRTVRCWDAVTGEQVLALRGHISCLTSCSFSPDGKEIVSSSEDRNVKIWHAASGGQVSIMKGHTHMVTTCSFSPDGKKIVSGSGDRTVRIWDAVTGGQVLVLKGHTYTVTACSFSPDSKHIVSGSHDKTVRIWNVTTGKLVLVLEGHTCLVTSCSFSPDGKYIVSGSHDRTVRIWDTLTGGLVSILQGHTDKVNSCSFSPNGKHIITGSDDNTIKIWDTLTGGQNSVLHGNTGVISSCSISPYGTQIITGSNDNTMRVWDSITGREISVLEGHTDSVTSCGFSPSGKYIISGSGDNTVRIWDMFTVGQVSVLQGHTHQVTSCSFSPDGKHIVSGSVDSTVRIWDAVTGRQVSVLEGHIYTVTTCSFSPDSKHIISGSNDNTVRIWDAVTREQISVLAGHTSWITSCCFSPDGRHIVSGSNDGTVRIWDAITKYCIANISCSHACLQYVPGTTTLLLLSSHIETPPQLDVFIHYMPGLSMHTMWLDREGFLYVNSELICWITPDRRPDQPEAMSILSHGEQTIIVLGSEIGLVTILDVTAAMSQ